MADRVDILLPVARLVSGSLYKAKPLVDEKTKQPRLGKDGQQMVDFYIGVAIPKDGNPWTHTEWGKQLYAIGAAGNPVAVQRPDFAWKVIDGDSTVPNRNNVRPCDRVGYKGHWIIGISSGFACPVYRLDQANNPVAWPEKDAVNLGDYVEASINVLYNNSAQSPGLYINHNAVCFRGYGERIVVAGTDVSQVGFGRAAAPQGASQVPQGASAVPNGAVTPPPGAVAAPPAVVAPPVAVAPATTYMTPPPVVTAPPVPVAPPAPPAAPVMTAKAVGATYESFIAGGWTDELLKMHGYIA